MGTKATEYKRQFAAEKYERIELAVPKGTKAEIKSVAAEKGISVAGYIKTAVKAQYKADAGKDIEL